MPVKSKDTFRIYHIFQRMIYKVFLDESNMKRFKGIIKRKGFHQRYRFAGWQTLLYPLSNNELILRDKKILPKLSKARVTDP